MAPNRQWCVYSLTPSRPLICAPLPLPARRRIAAHGRTWMPTYPPIARTSLHGASHSHEPRA
jgi:hypothetical protein